MDIPELCRIKLTDEEQERLEAEMKQILDWAGEIGVPEAKPTAFEAIVPRGDRARKSAYDIRFPKTKDGKIVI
ncbi:MAG: hypothetical protein J4432_00665 [DPANN group archaeon]|nr:hypothetical protein [DPANN group archaeon]